MVILSTDVAVPFAVLAKFNLVPLADAVWLSDEVAYTWAIDGQSCVSVHPTQPRLTPAAFSCVFLRMRYGSHVAATSASHPTTNGSVGVIHPIPTCHPAVIVNADSFPSSVCSAVTILFHSDAESWLVPAVAAAG